jgi:hypothetical protein
MDGRKIAAALLLAAGLLAGCAGGAPFQAGEPVVFRTEFRNDVGSWCAKSEPVYDAHRFSCAVTPVHVACTAANMTEAKQARENTRKECDSKPAETPANAAKVKGLVETQQSIARKQ